MKKSRFSWEQVAQLAGGDPVTVLYDGIERSGYCNEDHMMKMFGGCELVKLTRHTFEVSRWPEGRTICRDWRERINEEGET